MLTYHIIADQDPHDSLQREQTRVPTAMKLAMIHALAEDWRRTDAMRS